MALGHFQPDSVWSKKLSFWVWRKKPKGTANCTKARVHLGPTEGKPPSSPFSTTHNGTSRVLLPGPHFFTPASDLAPWDGEEGALESGNQDSNPGRPLTSCSTRSTHCLSTNLKSFGKATPFALGAPGEASGVIHSLHRDWPGFSLHHPQPPSMSGSQRERPSGQGAPETQLLGLMHR